MQDDGRDDPLEVIERKQAELDALVEEAHERGLLDKLTGAARDRLELALVLGRILKDPEALRQITMFAQSIDLESEGES